MAFTVEIRAAGGFRVVDENGHIAETRIPSRTAALEMARIFTEDPSLCAGMLDWHKRKTLAGPDSVQRPMGMGGKAKASQKANRRTGRPRGR